MSGTAVADGAGRAGTAGERRTMGAACGAHVLHDGYADVLYVLLPVWQAEFALGYAAVGTLRALYTGVMAGLQVPASLLAERFGGRLVLVLGTVLAAAGYLVAGASGGFLMLAVALVIGGIGGAVQHPVASHLVSQAYDGARSRAALGIYNFSGDIGKVVFPAAMAMLLALMPWRPAVALLGLAGLAVAFAVLVALPRAIGPVGARPERPGAAAAAAGGRAKGGFLLLLAIGVIDGATRTGFLTFLPFLLADKGADLPLVGIALTLTFAGGAAGKLVCGLLGARFGLLATVLLTEGLTAAGILALIVLPLEAGIALLPLVGLALNGTSSVLYGTVPDLVTSERRARAFGIFYTATVGSGAASPALYGLVGDLAGVPMALAAVAGVVLLTLPLAWLLRPQLRGG